MKIELTEQQFRYLLDLVYIGNWVINSTREDDRIREYDQVESLIFSHCLHHRMSKLVELYQGELIPSRAFADGGIHEAIEHYEDVAVSYTHLAFPHQRADSHPSAPGSLPAWSPPARAPPVPQASGSAAARPPPRYQGRASAPGCCSFHQPWSYPPFTV